MKEILKDFTAGIFALVLAPIWGIGLAMCGVGISVFFLIANLGSWARSKVTKHKHDSYFWPY